MSALTPLACQSACQPAFSPQRGPSLAPVCPISHPLAPPHARPTSRTSPALFFSPVYLPRSRVPAPPLHRCSTPPRGRFAVPRTLSPLLAPPHHSGFTRTLAAPRFTVYLIGTLPPPAAPHHASAPRRLRPLAPSSRCCARPAPRLRRSFSAALHPSLHQQNVQTNTM
ncbi:hypothetical protein DENSPDRAFT_452675 [Dentipellis sp. KUC8613]|nr:hypothetical protein DENSPDRAFT_452675 [Dentipellis sp. KUC8613]